MVIVGGLMAVKPALNIRASLLTAAFAAALVAAGVNAVNDACDRQVDLVNRPERPIPSGRLTAGMAWAWGALLSLSGIAVATQVSLPHTMIAAGVTAALTAYNLRLKFVPLMGNLIVALCAGTAFLFGSLAEDDVTSGLLPGLFAVLIHLSREIVKDLQDAKGDALGRGATVAHTLGNRQGGRLAAVFLMPLMVLSVAVYFMDIYGLYYLMILLPLVLTPLAWVVIRLWRWDSQSDLSKASRLLKLAMVGGLTALYFG